MINIFIIIIGVCGIIWSIIWGCGDDDMSINPYIYIEHKIKIHRKHKLDKISRNEREINNERECIENDLNNLFNNI